ncbi:saccharopine dehydrogenase NADP-binding domain-containing protein [Glycomyces harbinensis]|uniref:Saccharopine dehydrogenase NADP binding domain-containing protein n=1 Tax=Glycomyces harbinensis TaxID=58114 RepID=A0A1G6QWD7_9ACTN|nr:saccharopine dehydrogenase NADP-binding domain-containing protein [Glycomyces harbinensis]SDC96700.1 Saccharopine dehydrogenase NADP binding domain-containing protein [Glycomyces harbinensis]
MSTALIIGMGDMGERIAAGLAASGAVRRLVVASRSAANVRAVAGIVASATDCLVEPTQLDATRVEDVAALLERVKPDLVVQCGSLRSPWALDGRKDPAAEAVEAAGLGIRLPYQLPIIVNVMRAARETGFAGPVANLSHPDVTGPVLERMGLAPMLGLGNAGMMLRRARAALRRESPDTEPPLVRVVGHHSQLDAVMTSDPPADPAERCRVYLGEEGRRDDGAAYRAPAIEPGMQNNFVTAAATVPVLEALLPEGPDLRWSVPAPGGLPGGYPVRISGGSIALDLPPGESLEDAIAFNERMARADGIERIDPDGTVHFTEAAREAVAGVAPDLAEPLAVGDIEGRADLLDEVLA